MIDFKTKYKKGIGKVSPTKLTTFHGCPLSYWFKYIEHVEVPVAPWAVFGNAIHYLIDEFFKKKFKSKKSFMNYGWFYWFKVVEGKLGPRTKISWSNPIRQRMMFKKYNISISIEQARRFAKEGIRLIRANEVEAISGYKTPRRFFSTKTQREQFKKFGIEITKEQERIFAKMGLRIEKDPKIYSLVAMKILSDFYDKNINIKRENILYHEKSVTQEFGGYKLWGKFDRIEKTPEGIEIIDYKTSKLSPEDPKAAFVLHHSVQFTEYSKIFRLWQKTNESRLLFYHLRSGKLFETKRSESDYEYLYQLIRTTDRRIREGDFTPFYGFHCKLCDYIFECNKRQVKVGEGMSAFIKKIENLFSDESYDSKLIEKIWTED